MSLPSCYDEFSKCIQDSKIKYKNTIVLTRPDFMNAFVEILIIYFSKSVYVNTRMFSLFLLKGMIYTMMYIVYTSFVVNV